MAVAYFNAWPLLRSILEVQWFTLEVAVHLVTSDLFPALKGWRIDSPATT